MIFFLSKPQNFLQGTSTNLRFSEVKQAKSHISMNSFRKPTISNNSSRGVYGWSTGARLIPALAPQWSPLGGQAVSISGGTGKRSQVVSCTEAGPEVRRLKILSRPLRPHHGSGKTSFPVAIPKHCMRESLAVTVRRVGG